MTSTLGAIAQVLAFLGTAATVALSLAAALLLVLLHRADWARRALAGGALLAGGYALVLLVVGASARTRVLGAGQPKAFCEIDCHVVYEVIASSPNDSGRYAVTVRELFDPESISPRRGDGPLTPGTRYFALVDDTGRRYEPTSVRMLDRDPLFASLRPGQAHRARLAFALPRGARPIGLLVESDDPVSALLIGHERSPFHGKVLLPVGT